MVHQMVMFAAEMHRVKTPGRLLFESNSGLLYLLELELLALQTTQVILLVLQVVGLLVSVQIRLLVEAFVTARIRAGKGLLPGVNS